MNVRCSLRGAKVARVDLAGVSVTGAAQEIDLDEDTLAAMRESARGKAQRYSRAKGWHVVAVDAKARHFELAPGDVLLTDLLVLELIDAAPIAWAPGGVTWAGGA